MNLLQDKKFLDRWMDLIYNFFKTTRNTDSDKLYYAAIQKLGQEASPKDEAPDEYGCVDSFEEVYKSAFGEYVGKKKTLSTTIMYQTLLIHPKFQRIDNPERGCVIISPTGHSIKANAIGHVGIFSDNCGTILSNDSRSGLWLENFTWRSWNLYYKDKLGLPVYLFKRL